MSDKVGIYFDYNDNMIMVIVIWESGLLYNNCFTLFDQEKAWANET